MLQVEQLKNFHKYKNKPTPFKDSVETDKSQDLETAKLTVNNLDKHKINQVPPDIVKMVDKETQTEGSFTQTD